MNQFVLQYGKSTELRLFPHIPEVGVEKIGALRLNSFPTTTKAESLRIYFIIEGRYEWCIGHRSFIFFPGDAALILPGVSFGSQNGVLDIGAFAWIQIAMERQGDGQMTPGKWSSLWESESVAICNLLSLNACPLLSRFGEAGKLLKCIQSELFGQEIGHQSRINYQLDDLLIQASRQITRQSHTGRDFPKTFTHLEDMLRRNLAHQWTVEEMAAMVGLSTTLFNERVKNYAGFSPLNYLINMRISEAIKLLKRPEISVTDIALETGFYSSQHFATTFKKLTGYKPSEFRKNNLRNI